MDPGDFNDLTEFYALARAAFVRAAADLRAAADRHEREGRPNLAYGFRCLADAYDAYPEGD